MNCAHPAIERWIVILAPSRNRDDLRFDILSNDAHLLQGEVAIGETPKCCRGGNHERRGTGNARASRRFGVCLDEQAFFRRKELKQPRTQGQSKSSRSPKLLKAGEVLLAPGIKGAQDHLPPPQGRDAAGSQDVDRKVQRQRARMKQVKRPQINRASRQIGAAWRLGDDRRSADRIPHFAHALFYHGDASDGVLVLPRSDVPPYWTRQ